MPDLFKNFTPEIFGITGYISLVLAMLVPVFWLLHWFKKPKRWFVHIAFFISLTAFVLAKYNSVFYVNLIEEDLSEKMAAEANKEDERRRRLEEMRSGDVAEIRFAEDSGVDALDIGGMDKTDLRLYNLEKKSKEHDPLAGMKKKQRTFTADNSLSASVDTSGKEEGADTDNIEEEVVPPVILKAEQLAVADKLDALNLNILRWFMLISLIYLLLDYLRRGNVYEEAYCPLPLPSHFFKSVSKFQPVMELPPVRRRKMIEELEFFTHRNEPFIYLGNDKDTLESLPEKGYRFLKKCCPVDYLPVEINGKKIDPDFIFESLWYNRSSFYCDSPEHAEHLLLRFIELMGERKDSRAETGQILRIVWDFKNPLPDDILTLFRLLGEETGISLVLSR